MQSIRISKSHLTKSQANTFNALETYWDEQGWYDRSSETFHLQNLLEIFNKLYDESLPAETRDLLLSTLSFLHHYETQKNKTELTLKSKSYLGHKDFKFELTGDTQTQSPVVKFLKEYLEETNLPPKEHLKRLALAQRITDSLKEINIYLDIDQGLKNKEISMIKWDRPSLTKSGEGNDSRYSLQHKLILDNNDEHIVQNSDFAGDRGYLKRGNRYIIIDDDLFPFIAKQRELSNLDRTEVIPLINNPECMIPPGTNSEKIDMSEYDQRIAGFEYAPKIKFQEIVSSNVSWYTTDDSDIPYLTINDENGKPTHVEINEKILKSLIAKIETSRNSGILLADGNPRPVQDDMGNWILASENNLEALKAALKTLQTANTKSKKLTQNSKRTQNLVAVLREIDLPESAGAVTTIALTKQLLESFLNPGTTLDIHQVEGVNWLLNAYLRQRGGVLLCDDMGLGKTLQLILFLVLLKHSKSQPTLSPIAEIVSHNKPCLVVCPLILLQNWEQEIKKFVKDEFRPKIYTLHNQNIKKIQKPNGRLFDYWWKNYDLILTNFNTLGRYQIDLLRYPYLVTVIDESQNVKNHQTAQSRAARGLKSEFVICATGTPVETKLMDLWAQIDTLKCRPTHPLGKEDRFTRDFENPNGREKVREIIKMNQPDGLMLRREKILLQAKGLLPNKIIHDPYCVRMTSLQETQELAIISANRRTPLKILQNLQKLYQHPFLLAADNSSNYSVNEIIKNSPKLQITLEILDKIKEKNEKVLIFTLFIQMQALLQKVLEAQYGFDVKIINGEVNRKASSSQKKLALSIIDEFSTKTGFNILILSPLVAGAGINITAANHVVHYGRWWNPAKEDQATDRAYRKGQTKDVHVYYPILINKKNEGFDYKLDQLIRQRRALAEDVLTPIDSLDVGHDFFSSLNMDKTG